MVLQLLQMGNTLTVRLPKELADWLDQASRETGVSRGALIRLELEKARKLTKRPFLRLAGAMDGPSDSSARKGFSRK